MLPNGATQCIPSLFPCRKFATLSGSMPSYTYGNKEDEEDQVRGSALPLAVDPAIPEIKNLAAHSGDGIKAIVNLGINRRLA